LNIEELRVKLKVEKTLTKAKQEQILKQLRRRFTREFLDLIILTRLNSVPYITGYALVEYVHQECNILLSSGTVYSTLYSMERNGLVRGEWKGRIRAYYITPQGEEVIQTVNQKIDVIKSIFFHFKILDSTEIS